MWLSLQRGMQSEPQYKHSLGVCAHNLRVQEMEAGGLEGLPTQGARGQPELPETPISKQIES